MQFKFISILIGALIALSTSTSVKSESTEDIARLNFACERQADIYTTVATSKINNARIAFLQWQPAILAGRTSASASELCQHVSQKLEYLSNEYDLTSIHLIGTSIDSVPAVCASGGGKDCSELLFELHATRENASIVANEVLDSIAIDSAQFQSSESKTRGVQSFAYQVDFWSLLGLKLPNR